MKDHLLAAPRNATHNALVAPEGYLRLGKRPRALAHLEDTSAAYQICVEMGGDAISLADWLVDFCSLNGADSLVGVEGKDAENHEACPKSAQRSGVACAHGEELLVRFERAVAELQVLGVVRPAKRRARGMFECQVHIDYGV